MPEKLDAPARSGLAAARCYPFPGLPLGKVLAFTAGRGGERSPAGLPCFESKTKRGASCRAEPLRPFPRPANPGAALGGASPRPGLYSDSPLPRALPFLG